MNQTVLITGANGNLGTAVTRLFLEQGYTVIATVINEEARKDLPAHERLEVEVVDLTQEKATGDFIRRLLASHPTIHAGLLLVGGYAMGSVADTSSEDIHKQLSLNFDTAYHVARPLYVHMQGKGFGRIVFIGARPALKAADGKKMVAYGLSKSLLFKLAEYINADAHGKDITATVVVPSTLDTEANRKSMPQADPASWVKPEDLAGILEFVVSSRGGPLRENVLKVYNNA
jgi:NAD(P)-dependent dehydrogenase (short-subunit alcohol dehydrogenase family)